MCNDSSDCTASIDFYHSVRKPHDRAGESGHTFLNQLLTSMLLNHVHHEIVIRISGVDFWIRTTLSTAKVVSLLSRPRLSHSSRIGHRWGWICTSSLRCRSICQLQVWTFSRDGALAAWYCVFRFVDACSASAAFFCTVFLVRRWSRVLRLAHTHTSVSAVKRFLWLSRCLSWCEGPRTGQDCTWYLWDFFLSLRFLPRYEGPRAAFLLRHLSFDLGSDLGVLVKVQPRWVVPPLFLFALGPTLLNICHVASADQERKS